MGFGYLLTIQGMRLLQAGGYPIRKGGHGQ